MDGPIFFDFGASGSGHPSHAARWRGHLRFLLGRSGDRCVASGGRVTFATLRTLAARQVNFFFIGGALLPTEQLLRVRLGCSLRISAAAGTGTALVASKQVTFRTDALQVRKGNPPTPINAGSEPKARTINQGALVWPDSRRSSTMRKSTR